jgi:cytochrome c oxidase accessory protein FixG
MTHLPIFDGRELTSEALPLDGHRRAIQPADVRGRFQRARRVGFAFLVGLWAVLPWLRVGGNPAVFIDVEARRLFLFGATFNAQDTWLLFFLLTGVGFGLVYATTLAGRMWCGWACPQTVFLEGVFRPIERWLEGPREKRLRRNAGPWTLDRVARKAAVHALYLVAAFLIAHVFLSYFASLPQTLRMVRQSPSAHPEAFVWAASMTAAFYANFAWFREQMCVVICPYGRLQAAMLDPHSLVIGYDARRGEPRGKVREKDAGDCVDCKRCVVVCPTGIDIRNGVQMECIACAACVDACDEIMDRLGRPRGLVRYDSLDGLAGKPRRILRARVVLYTVLLVIGAVVALAATRTRIDFEATLLRLPGEPYSVEGGLEGGRVTNALQVHVVNKRASAETYRLTVEPSEAMTAVVPMPTVAVGPMSDVRVPVFLSAPRDRFGHDFPVHVEVTRAGGSGRTIRLGGTFLGPSR